MGRLSGRIGVFGGTFDPPHLGHLILAESALAGFNLERVLFVLNGDPPHKKTQIITPVENRLAMLHAATEGNPRFEISRIEIDRPGPYYTFETLRLLHTQYAGAEMIFLMGADSLRDLPTWHKPEEILQHAAMGVMQRPGERVYLDVLLDRLPELEGRVRVMEAPEIGIAARTLRRRVAQGESIRYQVTEPVRAYIDTHQLYREIL